MSEKHIGEVVQVIGPVLDIRFAHDELPALLNAIEIESNGAKLTAEVAQQIGDDVVRCIAMNSTDGLVRSWFVIYRISKKVKYSSQADISYRNCDRAAGIYCLRAPDKTVGRVHGNTSYDIVANLLCYLGCQLCAV